MTTAPDALTIDREGLRLTGRKVRKRLSANPAARRVEIDKVELWTVPRFLDPVECGRLMAMIDAVAEPSKAYEADYAGGHRTSYSGNLNAFDPLVRQLQRRIDALLGLDGANAETLQGQRYLPGQEFRPHLDWFGPNTPAWAAESHRGGQRAITAMAYLNPVEEGGETDFPRLGIAVRPRPGMLLVWNNANEDGIPNPWVVHAGKPVLRGQKYIVTKWYRTRRWI